MSTFSEDLVRADYELEDGRRVRECRRRGWYAVLVPGEGWRPSPPDAPGAIEDRNRLVVFEATGADVLYEKETRC